MTSLYHLHIYPNSIWNDMGDIKLHMKTFAGTYQSPKTLSISKHK